MAAQLEQLGLVSIQKGRAGTCITPQGLELLAVMSQNWFPSGHKLVNNLTCFIRFSTRFKESSEKAGQIG